MYAKYVKHVQEHVNDHFVHIQSQQNYLISLTFSKNLNNRKSTQRIKGKGKHTNNDYNVTEMSTRIKHRESKVNKRTGGVEAQELKRRVERLL
jgi:hypothetical protein